MTTLQNFGEGLHKVSSEKVSAGRFHLVSYSLYLPMTLECVLPFFAGSWTSRPTADGLEVVTEPPFIPLSPDMCVLPCVIDPVLMFWPPGDICRLVHLT